MAFNEDSRVKIPAILHLTRLGYTYLSLKESSWEQSTNIFTDLFIESIGRINPNVEEEDIRRLLDELILLLDYEDLGRAFYERLTATSGIRLIDFNNFNRNSFHVVTELTCKNGDEEFRPDITVLINGMPVSFIEVKKPHNKGGVIEERKRINRRFQNKYFRKFANITQFMVFSNNMEYEDGVVDPVFGAFYATAAYGDLKFNFFREDPDYPVRQPLAPPGDELENRVLRDNNLHVIKHNAEFQTNKFENTPTNRILSSLYSRERLQFLLRYAIAYIEEEDNGKKVWQKHIMRYPQLFATKAIAAKLDAGQSRGIIWHTQGSGKTALAYFNVKHLTYYFARQNTVPKFYFIVDRMDLLIQASTEFSNRGLKVKTVNSKAGFIIDLQTVGAIHNDSGQPEITVVNIQKFSEDATVRQVPEYDLNIQRIFFLDEAHRSYNPKGNYLANLINSDRKAIKIALTGTPLLREVVKDFDSKMLFGNYIHKYYYNWSIADGYTLRLIREEIEGAFSLKMQKVMEQIKVLKGEIQAKEIYAHERFAKPLLDYITNDLIQFWRTEQDSSLGGMVVCDSSKQARTLFRLFEEHHGAQETDAAMLMAADDPVPYGKNSKPRLTAALILHDENDKTVRKELIKAFKKGKVDLLFVYGMLLTGFDSNRLKKLYLARVVHDHNLLQTLTRVNRPYKKYQYGYVVDFADISKQFDRTNRLYFDELQEELGDEMSIYSHLFKTEDEIKQELDEIRETLFHYNSDNRELFAQQVEQITDKQELNRLIKALQLARELKSMIALNGYEALHGIADFDFWNSMLSTARARLDNLNLLENIGNEEATQNLLNTALEDVLFQFIKVGEEELKLADEFKEMLRKTREALQDNIDQRDPEFVNLREELERIFKKRNLNELSQLNMGENMQLLKKIYDRTKELNRKNNLLRVKYANDAKYARIHKRLTEKGQLNSKEMQLYRALMQVKQQVDNKLEGQEDLVGNDGYFDRYLMQMVVNEFRRNENIQLDFLTTESINQLIKKEYVQEYNARF